MAISIKSPEADRLARDLAAITGESITVAITASMRERLERQKRRQEDKQMLIADLMAIAEHCASLPVIDSRTEDEIMGWDENGLPS
jgi:antitoxin VapB